MKKIFATFGIMSFSLAPITTVIACDKNNKELNLIWTSQELLDNLVFSMENMYFELTNQVMYSSKSYSSIDPMYKHVNVLGLSNEIQNKSPEAIFAEIGIDQYYKNVDFKGARITNIIVQDPIRGTLQGGTNPFYKLRYKFTLEKGDAKAQTNEIVISAFESNEDVNSYNTMQKGIAALDERGWYHYNSLKKKDNVTSIKTSLFTDEKLAMEIDTDFPMENVGTINTTLGVSGGIGPIDTGYNGALPIGMTTVGSKLTLRLEECLIPQASVEVPTSEVDEDGNEITKTVSGKTFYVIFTSQIGKIKVRSVNPALLRSYDFIEQRQHDMVVSYVEDIEDFIGTEDIVIADTNRHFTKFPNLPARSRVSTTQIGLDKLLNQKLLMFIQSTNGTFDIQLVDAVTEDSTEVTFTIKLNIKNDYDISRTFTARLA